MTEHQFAKWFATLLGGAVSTWIALDVQAAMNQNIGAGLGSLPDAFAKLFLFTSAAALAGAALGYWIAAKTHH